MLQVSKQGMTASSIASVHVTTRAYTTYSDVRTQHVPTSYGLEQRSTNIEHLTSIRSLQLLPLEHNLFPAAALGGDRPTWALL